MSTSPVIISPQTVALFVGKRGTGKSWKRKQLLTAAVASGMRVLSLDMLDEDSIHGRKRKAVELGPLTQRMTTDELAESLDVLRQERLALAVVPVNDDPREWALDVEAILVEVQEEGDLLLSLTELAVWSQYAAAALNKAALLSRHWGDEGVPIAADSQRATGIPFSFRTQATDILSGLQDMPEDLDALGDRCGPRFADEVGACRGHEFRHWRDSDGRWERPQPRGKTSQRNRK